MAGSLGLSSFGLAVSSVTSVAGGSPEVVVSLGTADGTSPADVDSVIISSDASATKITLLVGNRQALQATPPLAPVSTVTSAVTSTATAPSLAWSPPASSVA